MFASLFDWVDIYTTDTGAEMELFTFTVSLAFTADYKCLCLFKCKWTALKQNTGVNKYAFRRCFHPDNESCYSLLSEQYCHLKTFSLSSTSEFYSLACFNTELTLNNLQQLVWQTFHMWALETEHNCLRMSSTLTALFLIKSSGGSVHILNYDIRSGWHFQWHLALIVIATERISF